MNQPSSVEASPIRAPVWLRNVFLCMLVLLMAATAARGLLRPEEKPDRWQQVQLPKWRRGVEFEQSLQRLDQALARRWQQAGVEPAPKAPLLLLARRVALALCGTVPSLEEIRRLERYRGPDPLGWWTQGLLEDPRCHDYLAERLARSLVGVEVGPFIVYRRQRFVGYLADQLAQDRPWDQVVREILTARGLWTNQPQANFITVTLDDNDQEQPDPVSLAARTARGLLGVRMDCAECHDHPFDRWTQQDFHQLAAFFAPVEVRFFGVRDGQRHYYWKPLGAERPVRGYPRVPFAAELLPKQGVPRQRLARWVTHPQNRAFARATVNRMWAVVFGRPLVEPVDNIPLEGDVPEELDLLAEDFVRHGFRLRRLVHLMVASQAFARDSLEPPGADRRHVEKAVANWAIFPLTPLRPEQVARSILQATSPGTIDHQSHVLVRLVRWAGEREFVQRYGDLGEEEFAPRGATIPQRLLLLNGKLVTERTRPEPPLGASFQVAHFAADDEEAVRIAFLAVLTRAPEPEELRFFAAWLDGTQGRRRQRAIEDLYATLLNSTEFGWNH